MNFNQKLINIEKIVDYPIGTVIKIPGIDMIANEFNTTQIEIENNPNLYNIEDSLFNIDKSYQMMYFELSEIGPVFMDINTGMFVWWGNIWGLYKVIDLSNYEKISYLLTANINHCLSYLEDVDLYENKIKKLLKEIQILINIKNSLYEDKENNNCKAYNE